MGQDKPQLFTFTCPACYGVLRAVSPEVYQCSKSHSYSLDELITAQNQTIERLLGLLYRIATERTASLERLVQRQSSSSWLDRQIADARGVAGVIRKLLQKHNT